MFRNTRSLRGLIPAAGAASRLAQLPFNKGLLPVLLNQVFPPQIQTPLGRLLTAIKEAGAQHAIVVSPPHRTDVTDYIGDGSRFGIPTAHLLLRPTSSLPHTIRAAHPFMRDSHVILGLPDIIFEPTEAISAIVSRQATSKADVMLGLMPTARRDKSDMVDVDEHLQVIDIVSKSKSNLRYAWVFAVWGPQFSEFLSQYVDRRNGEADNLSELQLAEVFLAARQQGLTVQGETVLKGRFLDLGTPEALLELTQFVGT